MQESAKLMFPQVKMGESEEERRGEGGRGGHWG